MVIAVAGATGNVGSALVEQLAADGHEVRAIVRSADVSLPAGATAVVGDLSDAASVAGAFAGAEAAFLLAGYDDAGLVAAMQQGGVQRAVLLSSSAAPSGKLDNAVAAYHLRSEQALRDSGLAWTFVRPNAFMSNALRWADRIRAGEPVAIPFADVAISVNDPRDLAAIAALGLTTGEHDGVIHRVTGPEALLPTQQLAILGEALGRELPFHVQDNDEARADMLARMPQMYVDAFFEFYVDGLIDETSVLPTIEQVTGRPPRTFQAWAPEHVDAFRA